MKKEPILAPSLLSADFSDLSGALKMIEKGGGKWAHIDVMDGVFVPQITYGQPVISSLRAKTDLVFDVHLMTVSPELSIESFKKSGADYITFQWEATVHHHRVVQQIHEVGAKAGISLVPSTPVSALSEILPEVDLVLVMTVNPGFGGQKLIERCVSKISQLCEIREKMGLDFKISVDGGINSKTVESVLSAGADVIVSGSAFFSGEFKWNY